VLVYGGNLVPVSGYPLLGVDDVRVKLNKSKLSKGSDDNWSKTLYKIGKVMRKQEHTSRALQTCEESEGERRRKKIPETIYRVDVR